MIDLENNEDIKTAIETLNKEFKPLGIIITDTISAIIVFSLITLTVMLTKIFPISWSNWLFFNAVAYSGQIFYDVDKKHKKFKRDKIKAKAALSSLAGELTYSANVPVELNRLKNAVITEDKSINIKINKDENEKTEMFNRFIYFLDNNNNLQVLRELRNVFYSNNKQINDTNDLTLLEAGEVPIEAQYTVERRLVHVNEKRNN